MRPTNPLGDSTDAFLSRLSDAENAHDSLSLVVIEALHAGGLQVERAHRHFDLAFTADAAPEAIADLAIEVKTRVRGAANLRRYAEELAIHLREEDDIERLLVLYGEGPPSQGLRLDFDPGPLRFRRVDEFIEQLRENQPIEVIPRIDRAGQHHHPVVGEVVEVGSAEDSLAIVRPLGEDTRAVRFGAGGAPSAPVRVGEHLLFEYRLPFDAESATVTAAAAPPPGLSPESPVKRIGAWVESGGERTPGPLRSGLEYVLRFKVGDPELATLLEDEEADVPLSDIPVQGLDTVWTVYAERLTFHPKPPVTGAGDVGAPSDTVVFELHIPRQGDSGTVDVPFTAGAAGPVAIHIEIRASDRVYRRLSATLEIVDADPDPGAGRASTLTVGTDTTYIRADSIAALSNKERCFVDIVVFNKQAFVTALLPDGTRPRRTISWSVNAADLDEQLSRVREALEQLREAHDPYLNDISPEDLKAELASFDPIDDWSGLPDDRTDPDHREAWEVVRDSDELGELAAAGHTLYNTVFPNGSMLRGWLDALPVGSRLTINWPQDAPADIPWGLFYRPLARDQVDPMGFLGLGLRLVHYAYEPATPANAFLGEPETSPTAMCLFWGVEPPISAEAGRQAEELKGPGVVLMPPPEAVRPRETLLQYLKGPNRNAPAVLYFYCQYGHIPPHDEGLRFGDDNRKESFLSTLTLGGEEIRGAPLVFANACATGGEDAYHASQIKRHFLTNGGWAYLGTETKVPVELASRIATVFFRLFRSRDGGHSLPAGEALSQTRLFFWTHYRNLGGLFYSYVNEPELQLRAIPSDGT